MFGSRFFWKLYLTFAVLVLVTLSGTGFLVQQQLRRSLEADVETSLYRVAVSLEPTASTAFEAHAALGNDAAADTPPTFDPVVQAMIEHLGDRTDTRITLVATDGVVIADSERNPSELDNHGQRPEILESTTQPYGVGSRFSDSVQQELLYVALQLRSDGEPAGWVRTSVPLSAVDARLAAMRETLFVGAGLGMLIALGAGLLVARRITAPISEMTEVAEALRAGDYDRRVVTQRTDEIGLLGETLNRLTGELAQRIATLASQRSLLSAMIAGLQEGVFAIDERDQLVFHNAAADELLRLERLRPSQPVWEVIDAAELASMCRATRDSGSPLHREIRVRVHDREYVLDVHSTAFETEGTQGTVAVLHDITNLRRLEQMRTDFVANVSHELKTPLTSIRGYVETLIGGAIYDDANNLRFLKKIDKQVERLSAMVTDVLSLARIEADEDEDIAAAVTDWRATVASAVDRYRDNGLLDDHTFRVELPDAPVCIAAGEDSMMQIIDNLVDNAIKYTPSGGDITVRCYVRDDKAVVEVEDTGIGISAEDIQRIFERFYRADRARSRDTGGTGLGLAIVKHLAQTFDGEVHVTSDVGSGSTFAVWAPVVAPPPELARIDKQVASVAPRPTPPSAR